MREFSFKTIARPSILVICAIAIVSVVGCSSAGTSASESTPMTGPAATSGVASSAGSTSFGNHSNASSAVTTHNLCLAAFSNNELLAWATDNVAGIRSYRYGGSVPTYPAASAFPGVAADTPSAWCGTLLRADTIRWWAMIDGQQPIKMLDITGPGATAKRGQVAPPAPPPGP